MWGACDSIGCFSFPAAISYYVSPSTNQTLVLPERTDRLGVQQGGTRAYNQSIF